MSDVFTGGHWGVLHDLFEGFKDFVLTPWTRYLSVADQSFVVNQIIRCCGRTHADHITAINMQDPNPKTSDELPTCFKHA